MNRYFNTKNCNLNLLKDKVIAIIGFGSQGRAHALNLRDSGLNVIIGQRKGARRDDALKEGFTTLEIAEASAKADLLMILLPDELQGDIYKKEIAPFMRDGAILAFAHGFSIHFHTICPNSTTDVILIAPKGPGVALRSQYLAGGGLPVLVGTHINYSGQALDFALAYAAGIGSDRSAIIETSFSDECICDLFSEQSILCGGLISLILLGFDTLVSSGASEEVAYFECLHEVKLIADMIHKNGILKMSQGISNAAEFGMRETIETLTQTLRPEFQKILANIKNGEFAKKLLAEKYNNYKNLENFRKELANKKIEEVGAKLRKIIIKEEH